LGLTLSKALLSISLAVLAILGILGLTGMGVNRKLLIPLILLAAYFIATLVSVFYSYNQEEALRKLILKLPLIVIPFIYVAFYRLPAHYRIFLILIPAYSAFLPASVSVFNYFRNKEL